MKIFLLGDFVSNNGPGNANKQIAKSLKKYGAKYSTQRNTLGRIIEAFIGVVSCDILIVCSKSKLNYFAMRVAKCLRKKILYVLHGYCPYENKINNPQISQNELNKLKSYDDFTFRYSDRIICVSKMEMNFMKKVESKYADKFDYVYNVVDLKLPDCINIPENHADENVQILSTGGGMRRKNNLIVASVLQELQDKYDGLNYIVIGDKLTDGININEFSCVRWIDSVSHDEMLDIMRNTYLCIQDSVFDTFGLSVIEALLSGSNILISNNVGCKELFSTITEDDIIFNINDKNEIKRKIQNLLVKGNNKRLIKGFKYECITKKWQSDKFKKIISDLFV